MKRVLICLPSLFLLGSCLPQPHLDTRTAGHSPRKTDASANSSESSRAVVVVEEPRVAERQDGFTFGSSSDHVGSLLGAPDRVFDGTFSDTWYYKNGASVTFKEGRVTSWSGASGTLPVYVGSSPTSTGSPAGRIKNGGRGLTSISASDTKETVGAKLGAPDRVFDGSYSDTWYYDGSSITFENETVSRKNVSSTASAQSRSYTPATSYLQPTTRSRYYNPSYRPAVGDHYVRGYYRKDGTYVRGHYRTNKDDSFWNNYSSHGNINPYTGRTGTKKPSSYRSYSGGSTYVRGYFRKDGTYVSGHYRRR